MNELKLQSLADETRKDIIAFAKEQYTNEPDIPELGDYIPFLYYFEEEEWVRDQVAQSGPELRRPAPPFLREDTMVGLLEYHRLSGDEDAIDLTTEYFDYLFDNYVHDGAIQTPYIRRLENELGYASKHLSKKSLRIVARLTKSLVTPFSHLNVPPYQALPRNGVFIEMLVDAYEATGDEAHLDRARTLADTWLETDEFRSYGLFPTPHPIYWRSNYVLLFKGNTGVINGLLALFEATGNDRYSSAVETWVNAVQKYCVKETVHGRYRFDTGKTDLAELRFTFPFIDALCYAAYATGNENYLNIAKPIADFWLDRQGDTGLFPLYPDGNNSHLDVMTDFCVALWRLAELTGENRYRDAAQRGLSGLFEHHRFPLFVDINTGEVTDCTLVPRFATLMAKAVILCDVDTIYGDRENFKLLRDR